MKGTQSFVSGAVKLRDAPPVVAGAAEKTPVLGLYHSTLNVPDAAERPTVTDPPVPR